MTTSVAIGLNRWDWRTPKRFADSVKQGEAVGIEYAFVPVNPLALWDPYALMAAGALATSTMRFGPLLETPALRSPAIAAGSIATIDEISDGRALFTYGIGDTAVRWLGKKPSKIAEVEDAVIETRALLAGERLDVGAAKPAYLRHARPVPVWVAASGPRSLRMAGRVADGVFLRVGTSPANLIAAMEHIRTGATEAGRDPSEVSIGIIVHTSQSEDAAEVHAIGRAMAAGFYEYAPSLFEQAGFEWNGTPIEELKERIWPDFHHASDLREAGQLVDFLGEDVANSFSFRGTTSDIADQVRSVVAAVPEVEILVPHPVPMPAGPDGIGGFIDWLGRDLIPAIA